MARITAWPAFCLNQSKAYAKDAEYGQNGFNQICRRIEEATSSKNQFSPQQSPKQVRTLSRDPGTSKEIVSNYDELVRSIG